MKGKQPRPLHRTFNDYRYTNRAQRRDKKWVKAALRDAIKSGDMRRYDGIREEVDQRSLLK